jgi:hypothetical protein
LENEITDGFVIRFSFGSLMLQARYVAAANICENAMTNENTALTHADSEVELTEDHFEEDFETAAEYHRMAALHFSAAAKHHLAAATADDENDHESTARHAFQAFRHQLNAVQYAEIAVMDNDSLEDEQDDEAAIS